MKKYIAALIFGLLVSGQVFAATPQEQYVSALQQLISLLEKQLVLLTQQLADLEQTPVVSNPVSTPVIPNPVSIGSSGESFMQPFINNINTIIMPIPITHTVSLENISNGNDKVNNFKITSDVPLNIKRLTLKVISGEGEIKDLQIQIKSNTYTDIQPLTQEGTTSVFDLGGYSKMNTFRLPLSNQTSSQYQIEIVGAESTIETLDGVPVTFEDITLPVVTL